MWSPAFQRALVDGRPRIHLVEAYERPEQLGGDGYLWRVASRRGLGGLAGVGIHEQAPGTSSGAQVKPGAWQSSVGQWTVNLVGDPRALWRSMWKGQMVVHRMGFPGWPVERFEVVQSGTLDDVTGRPGRFTLVMKDLLSAFTSRYATSPTQWPLFAGLGATTQLTEQYDVGAETSLDVVSASALGRDSGATSGDRYAAILVDPEAEDAYFHRYNGVSGNSLTRPAYSPNTDLATAHQTKTSGTTVQEVALVEGPVTEVVRRILVSTGAGTNGTFDTLPATWGLALADALVDHEDSRFWSSHLAPATGSDHISLHTTQQQDNGLAWLAQQLAPLGVFLTMRQGRITVRCAVDPNAVNLSGASPLLPLTGRIRQEDLDAASDMGWSAWRGGATREARSLFLYTGGGYASGSSYTETVRSHPAQATVERDLSKLVFTNDTAWKASTAARLKPWDLRLAERLVLPVRNAMAAGLAPGDTLELDLPFFAGRHEYEERGWTGRAGMVTQVDPDFWLGGPTKVVLACPPDRDDRLS